MTEYIANLIAKATGEAEAKVTIPENPDHGHYATNLALVVAKKRGMNPREAAEVMRDEIVRKSAKGIFQKIEIAGPGFLNFFLSEKTLKAEISRAIKEKSGYGTAKVGKGKVAIVEFSSPNIAKPMSVGHLRSTVIGDALANLLRSQGYKVITDNHLGDWGTQFGKLIYAWKNWRDEDVFKKAPIKHLTDLYISFHKEAEKDENLEDIAREETAKLQRGDKENTRLWKIFVRESAKEFNKIYKRLGIKFDLSLGESFYEPMLAGVVSDALNKGVARENEGAIKIFFEDGKPLPPQVIEKSDGAHLYPTTDLATIKYRAKKYRPAKVLYVVANEQALHFEQVFRAAEMLGYIPEDSELTHVKFGMMLGESGKKFSTRKGEFITLQELLDRAVSEAALINKESAEKVGVGAIKYYDLSHYRMSDIAFNWDAVLDLKGNSAPYLQYTYTRFRSVIKKAVGVRRLVNLAPLSTEAEKRLVDLLIHYPDAVAYAAEKYEPNHLTDYLFRLSNAANGFYEACPIIGAESKIAAARLALVEATTIVIKNGLKLLGIEVMEKM